MTDQDKKFKEYWDKVRANGRLKYALINGAVFGFGVFVVLNLWYLKDLSVLEVYGTRKALEQMLTMILAGILGYGTLKWWMNERIYKKIMDQIQSQTSDK